MATRKGKAVMTFPTQQMNGTREVTEVIARTEAGEEVAFYIDRASAAPAFGDELEWGTHHVTVTRPGGSQITLAKIGYDLDPNGPLR
jgi:hypothetical protein